MNLAVKTAGVAVLGIAVVACGNGDGGDEGAIENVFRDFFRAFEDRDEERLAGLLSTECEDPEKIAAGALESYDLQGFEGASYDISGATIRNLTETTAEAIPEGTVKFPGGESPLSETDPEYAGFIKEDGRWKLADCNILFGT